jgi:hypothetical protein
MSDKRLVDIAELTAVADDDWLYIVDKSDTSESPEGTSRKVQVNTLSLATLNQFDIRLYGAVIDGITDDSVAVSAALSANGIALFPVGTTLIASDISMSANDVLIGANWRTSIISLSGVGTSILMDDWCTIRDLKISGADTNTFGILVSATASRWLIDHVNIGDCLNGLGLENTWIGTVKDCLIRDCTDGIHVGNSLNGDGPVNSIRIVGGEIAACTYGIHFDNDGNGNTSINAFNVRDIAIEPSGTYGVWVEGQSIGSLKFDGVYWEACGDACYRQDVGAQSVQFDGGLMDLDSASSDAGIEVTAGITDSLQIRGVESDRRSGSVATDAVRIASGTTVITTIEGGTRGDSALVVANNSTTAGTAITYIRSDFESQTTKLPGISSLGGGTRPNSENFLQEATLLNTNTTVAIAFSTNEADADYEVFCGDFAQDLGGYWITSKATTGFTVNFANAASGNTVFHYMVTRR